MVLLSVHQTHEGAATKRLSTAARLKSKRLRDILGMRHRESIYVLDAKISWNAFHGIVTFWIITTVLVWMCRLELKVVQTLARIHVSLVY